MDGTKSLKRYFLTRRVTGRRSITPMKTKQKKTVPKTRGHKVEKKPYVPIRKHTSPQQHGERQREDSREHGEDSERQRNQDSCLEAGRKDKEEYTQVEQGGTTENSEKSVHPGPLQTVPEMYTCADDTQTSETCIEAEELQ
jgi:hypothetical protein